MPFKLQGQPRLTVFFEWIIRELRNLSHFLSILMTSKSAFIHGDLEFIYKKCKSRFLLV